MIMVFLKEFLPKFHGWSIFFSHFFVVLFYAHSQKIHFFLSVVPWKHFLLLITKTFRMFLKVLMKKNFLNLFKRHYYVSNNNFQPLDKNILRSYSSQLFRKPFRTLYVCQVKSTKALLLWTDNRNAETFLSPLKKLLFLLFKRGLHWNKQFTFLTLQNRRVNSVDLLVGLKTYFHLFCFLFVLVIQKLNLFSYILWFDSMNLNIWMHDLGISF